HGYARIDARFLAPVLLVIAARYLLSQAGAGLPVHHDSVQHPRLRCNVAPLRSAHLPHVGFVRASLSPRRPQATPLSPRSLRHSNRPAAAINRGSRLYASPGIRDRSLVTAPLLHRVLPYRVARADHCRQAIPAAVTDQWPELAPFAPPAEHRRRRYSSRYRRTVGRPQRVKVSPNLRW